MKLRPLITTIGIMSVFIVFLSLFFLIIPFNLDYYKTFDGIGAIILIIILGLMIYFAISNEEKESNKEINEGGSETKKRSLWFAIIWYAIIIIISIILALLASPKPQ